MHVPINICREFSVVRTLPELQGVQSGHACLVASERPEMQGSVRVAFSLWSSTFSPLLLVVLWRLSVQRDNHNTTKASLCLHQLYTIFPTLSYILWLYLFGCTVFFCYLLSEARTWFDLHWDFLHHYFMNFIILTPPCHFPWLPLCLPINMINAMF